MHLDSRFQTEHTADLVGTFTEDLDLFRDGCTRTHHLRVTREASLAQVDVLLPLAGWSPLGWIVLDDEAPELAVVTKYAHLTDDLDVGKRVVARVLDLVDTSPAALTSRPVVPATDPTVPRVMIEVRKTRCHLGI